MSAIRELILVELDEVYREEYLHAVERARALHDPHSDWDGFVEALWARVLPAFGLDVEALPSGSIVNPDLGAPSD